MLDHQVDKQRRNKIKLETVTIPVPPGNTVHRREEGGGGAKSMLPSKDPRIELRQGHKTNL